jgi:hypothetical protein
MTVLEGSLMALSCKREELNEVRATRARANCFNVHRTFGRPHDSGVYLCEGARVCHSVDAGKLRLADAASAQGCDAFALHTSSNDARQTSKTSGRLNTPAMFWRNAPLSVSDAWPGEPCSTTARMRCSWAEVRLCGESLSAEYVFWRGDASLSGQPRLHLHSAR